MMPEVEQIRHFDRTGNTPIAWAMTADCLLTASRLLKVQRDTYYPTRLKAAQPIPDEGRVLFPELMLRGFGLECMMKGLWVKRGHELAIGGRYTGVKGAHDHNLVELAASAGLRFSSKENDVLKRLSIIMTSSGRYPIPRNWITRKIQRLQGGGKGIPEYWAIPSDDRTCESIIKTIEKELEVVRTKA